MDGSEEEIHAANQKINESTKSLVDRLCDFKICALSVLGYIGSVSAPDEATLKDEAHALQAHTTLFLLAYCVLALCAALA